jgi:exodeoxyribonuclease VII large subunit
MRVARERRRERFAAASGRLAASLRANAQAQQVRIARARERVDTLLSRAERAVATLLDRRYARLDRAGQLLTALSYHGVLARGFALVRSEVGRPLRAAAAINPGTRLDIEFADGRLRATAEARSLSAATASEPPLRRKARRSSDPGQGTLF